MPAAVTGAAAGHPNIRATHRKTLELTRDPAITARATCVVGVAAQLDEEALAALHGRVELTLSTGDRSETVRGRLNPAFQPGDPLVVRRAPALTRDAVIVDADRAASDLPRSFVEALRAPAARIAVRVEALTEPPGPGVLVVRPVSPGEVGDISPDIRGKCRPGQRVALEANLEDERTRAAIHAAHDAGHTVLPAPGLSLSDAVRAVGGLAPGTEVTEDVPAESLERRLARAERAAIVLDPGTPREEYIAWRAGEPLAIPGARGRRAAYAIEAAGEAGAGEAVAGEAVADGAAAAGLPDGALALARARDMAAAGASTRDVTRALQEGAGLPHRRAYELALDLTADTSSVSRPEPRTSR